MTAPRLVHAPKPALAQPAPTPVARPLLAPLSAILPYLARIDEARWYSNSGPLVCELEARLSARAQGAGVCTVVNATQGLALLLQAVTGGARGLCLVPGFTFVATAHAALQAGMTPWLVDVDARSWMLTPEGVRAALANAPGKVSAVVVVAAFGAQVDQAGFSELSRETGVPVVLDAAAGFDTLGSPLIPAVVSLHATKALAAGEGGYVTAHDTALVQRVRSTACFGFAGERRALFAATNAKMSEYGAAVALAALDGWDAARLRWMLAARKIRLAAGRSARFQDGWGERWVGSTCVAQVANGGADALAARMAEAGLETRRWWGQGLHREPAFVELPRQGLATTERLAASTLGLPFRLDLEDEDIRRIGRALRQA